MTLQYVDPAIPTGLTIMSRAYLLVLVEDLTFLADAISLIPLPTRWRTEPGRLGLRDCRLPRATC